jgi:hypothetical protein
LAVERPKKRYDQTLMADSWLKKRYDRMLMADS